MKEDKRDKVKVDLRNSKVMLGQRDNSNPYIYIEYDYAKQEALRISYDTEDAFNKWLEIIQLNRKSD